MQVKQHIRQELVLRHMPEAAKGWTRWIGDLHWHFFVNPTICDSNEKACRVLVNGTEIWMSKKSLCSFEEGLKFVAEYEETAKTSGTHRTTMPIAPE